MGIIVNTRSLLNPLTGVQRYLSEILKNTDSEIETVKPPQICASGVSGHAWEQIILPTKIKKNQVLWSPTNTGPLSVKKQVVSIMDFTTIEHPEWFNRNYALLYKYLLPRIVKKSLHVLTISEYTKERIVAITGVNPDQISVTPLAADTRFEVKDSVEVQRVKNKYDINNEYILTLGSLEPRKNLAKLFEAWVNWDFRPQELSLVVAGGTGKVFKNLGFDKIPKNVELIGRVDDVDLPGLYSGAKFFTYPSLYEGFGLPVIEAMACGTPVITSNVTSLPEVVGSAGILIDPFNSKSIMEGMQQLYSDDMLRNKLSMDGLLRAELFSWSKTAEATFNLLNDFSN
jgi:glycosyltransferase involved in cell wall biosynthesis